MPDPKLERRPVPARELWIAGFISARAPATNLATMVPFRIARFRRQAVVRCVVYRVLGILDRTEHPVAVGV
jgi:hypothetical protein